MCVLLITRHLWLVGRLGSEKLFNHSSWVAIVTPTDRPKSVRNRYVIEVFGGVFVLSLFFWDFSTGEGAFVIGLSQISFFLSQHKSTCKSKNGQDQVSGGVSVLCWHAAPAANVLFWLYYFFQKLHDLCEDTVVSCALNEQCVVDENSGRAECTPSGLYEEVKIE